MASMPLFAPATPDRPIAFHRGRPITRAEFERCVAAVVARLPADGCMINLCEDRYAFLAAFAAAACARHPVLLPPSRAERVVAEVASLHAGSYRCDDVRIEEAMLDSHPELQVTSQSVPSHHTVMIGFTSGSTAEPQQFPETVGRRRCEHSSQHARRSRGAGGR